MSIAWLGLVAYMTSDGFSGSQRYLMAPVALLMVLGGAGIGWGLGAAVCAAFYFMMSDEVTADGSGLHSITLAAGGLIVGAAAVALLGLTGVMPLTFTANNVVFAGITTSWVVPVLMLGVVSTAIAYTLGISGVARLRLALPLLRR